MEKAAIGLALFYFTPALIALARRHHQAAAIALTTTLLGWTIVGWICALIWSVSAKRAQPG